jgi:Domain of unknown function (DUF4440)
MSVSRVWASFALVSLMVIPALVVTQQSALAQAVPKAEWRADKTAKAKAKTAPKAKKAATAVVPPTSPPPATPPSDSQPATVQPAAVIDQSQEVLDIDFAMAAAIATQGPKDGYASALSDEGILYDANGASPVGREAAAARFGTFPADVTLVRTPERALAAGGSGSSWGTYTIKRGANILSSGRYISVWRREVSGWKMMSELAAGKTLAPPPAAPISGVLPKRPTSLPRAAPAPVGVPLTVPTPPPATVPIPSADAPPTQAPPTP